MLACELCCPAIAPTSAWSEQGFFSSRNFQIPTAVDQAGNSVVQLYFKAKNSAGDTVYVGSGSAFVVEDSWSLYTAAHVVALQEGPPTVGSFLTLEIFNNLGEKVFDTTSGSESAYVSRIGNPTQLKQDFAKIALTRPLNLRAIKINYDLLVAGQKIYSIGFPVLADIPKSSPQSIRDSVLRSRATMGKIISRDSAASGLVSATMEAAPGQSGSPLLDDEGEAVGILDAVASQTKQSETLSVATGPTFSGLVLPAEIKDSDLVSPDEKSGY